MATDIVQRKICMLGDFAVGKTSLVRRFVYNKFDFDYLATIGVQISRKEVVLDSAQARRATLVLWDLAGGETFSQMEESYYRGGAGALLVADVLRPETISILNTYASNFLRVNPDARLAIAFNKIDLLPDPESIQRRADDLSARWDAPYFLTSAANGAQVEEVFSTLTRGVIKS